MKNLNQKYIERFEQLIRVLQDLSPHEKRKHFEMTDWGVETECGTVCCAAGHAGLDAWFRRRGFKLGPADYGFWGEQPKRNIEYDGKVSWGALHAFFGFDPGVDYDGETDATAESAKIFEKPRSVGAVIKAAKARIKELQAATN